MSADRTRAEIVFAKEAELRPLRYETATAYDTNGTVLLEKRAEPGTPYEIAFTDAKIAVLKAASGVVFTHNYPQGWKYTSGDPRHAGNSFSPNDIELACRAGFAEIRAVSPRYRFSMRPLADRFTDAVWQTIAVIFQAEYEQANRELTLDAAAGRIDAAQMQIELLHETWQRTTALLGLHYERTEE